MMAIECKRKKTETHKVSWIVVLAVIIAVMLLVMLVLFTPIGPGSQLRDSSPTKFKNHCTVMAKTTCTMGSLPPDWDSEVNVDGKMMSCSEVVGTTCEVLED